jgi:hypothetical protein
VSGVWRGAPARAADASSAAGVVAPSGFVFLELNGRIVGSVKSVDGGTPVAEVVEEPRGPDGLVHKHIGNVKYNEFTVKLGLGMGKPVYDWISSAMLRKDPSMDGAFVGTDSELNQKRRTEFTNALITEVGFPASDAASPDPAYLTLKFAPEATTKKVASGKLSGRPSNQKQWLPANFRLKIGDLDTSHVSRIEAYPVKWELPAEGVREPGKIDFPNLKITVAESHAKPLYDWFDDFVIKGHNGQESELIGLLEWPTPDLSKVLASVSIRQMVIVGLAPAQPDPAAGIRRVRAEMYCEEMVFEYRPS